MIFSNLVFIGLGNPGKEYSGTRHNIGFEILEDLSRAIEKDKDFKIEGWKELKDFKIEVLKASYKDSFNFILCKPLGYMNRSGQVFKNYSDYYKIFRDKKVSFSSKADPLEVLVIHDEIDFDPGVTKIKLGGSSGGHNGIKDLISSLGTEWFYRLRVGVGHPVRSAGDSNNDVSDWVLSKAYGEDQIKIKSSRESSVETLIKFIKSGEIN